MAYEIIFIAGLPGSGKSTWAKFRAKTCASLIIDDASVLFNDTSHIVKLVRDNFDQVNTIFIIDVEFCRSEVVEEATEIFSREFPDLKQTWLYFENNPEHCLENIKAREDGREVEGFIKTYSKNYNPPANARPVYNAEREAKEQEAYLEEERVFQERMAAFDDIGEKYGLSSIWSNFTHGEDPVVIDQVPYPTATKLVYTRGFGKSGEIDIDPNSTWLDLWQAADKLIRQSGDDHHIFIEGFGYVKDDKGNKDLSSIEVYTGS